MSIALRIVVLASFIGAAAPAFAYVGPGAGLSLIAAFWALLIAVVSSLAFVVFWPLRKHLQRRKANAMRREAASTARMPGE